MTDHPSIHPDQARLVLYLAGELSPPERRAFEAVLAGDSSLRQQLEALRQVESSVNQSLSSGDAAESITGRLPSIERQVSKALSQWQVDRLTQSAPILARTRIRRVPVWLYPLSAAAVVMMCLGVWWLSLENIQEGAPQQQAGSGYVGDPDGPFDLALNELGSETFGELERDMATFQTLSETLQ